MKKFAIYQKGINDVILIQEGFNVYAAIFSGFWALYNRIWPLAIIGILLYGLQLTLSSIPLLMGLKILTFFTFGFMSDFIYQLYLERQGYVLADVVSAKNSEIAELKFYERNQRFDYSDNIEEVKANPWRM
jgi:hypothetical protein